MAADAVDLRVHKGETLGIVGESGSGKSTVARLLARLIEPTGGEIELDGRTSPGCAARPRVHSVGSVQVVFQDPVPIAQPAAHRGRGHLRRPAQLRREQAKGLERAAELMGLVKLSPGSLDRYPHEFSGGQRQRICIARALAVEPEVLIADEAVSALDVSVQAQILACSRKSNSACNSRWCSSPTICGSRRRFAIAWW